LPLHYPTIRDPVSSPDWPPGRLGKKIRKKRGSAPAPSLDLLSILLWALTHPG